MRQNEQSTVKDGCIFGFATKAVCRTPLVTLRSRCSRESASRARDARHYSPRTLGNLPSHSPVVWRLILFLLPALLFLLFLRRRLCFRLLELGRSRWLRRYRRRSALLLALRRRWRLRPQSTLVPVWLGLATYRTSGFGTVVRLWRGGAVIARRWLSQTVRLRTSRVTLTVRLVIRWLCGWTIRRRAVVRLIRDGTIVRLWRRRLIRLGRGWTIWLSGIRRARTLVWSLLIGRLVRRLVGGWHGGGLFPSSSIRLVRLGRGWSIPLHGVGRARTLAWSLLVARTARVRCCRFAGRRLLDHRVRSLSGRGTQFSHFAPRQRLSRMYCQSLLLVRKWDRRRRWRPLRDHLTVHHGLRRRRHMIRGCELRPQYAIPCRSHCNPRAHRGTSNLSCVHGNRCSPHGFGAHKGALRNRRHGTPYIPVRVSDIRDVRGLVDDRGVVHVRDLDVIDRRIANVHPVHILPADVVRRHINFPRTEWKPSHITAEANSNSPTANKDHQRGRIYRPDCDRPGHPTPASANCHPASVVERRVA